MSECEHRSPLPSDEEIAKLLDEISDPHLQRGANIDDVYYLRRTIFEYLHNPTSDSWQKAHSLILLDYHRQRSITLWRLVLEITSYNYGAHRQGEPWPVVPSPAQVLVALATMCSPIELSQPVSDPDQDIVF